MAEQEFSQTESVNEGIASEKSQQECLDQERDR